MSRTTRLRLRWLLALLTVGGACSLVRDQPSERWQARELQQHPLVGTIWDVAARRPIDADALLDRLASDVYVLLGDKHDNPDHHRLQARILSGLVAHGRRPAVAFEPMTVDRSGALAEALALPSPTSEGVIEAVRRADQGWPWALYAPVIAEALRAKLPIVAADLDPAWVRLLQTQGIAGLDPLLRAELDLADVPLPPAGRSRLEQEIRRSHCGHATDGMVARMIDAQRARDAHLARALIDGSADGAVLIAGAGHVRRDADVPLYLARWAPQASVASVAFLEVSPDETRFAATGAGDTASFDYVWFTPRVDLVDPCERFREQLGRMHAHGAE
jgi:uncharacterized iron-regulated protein